MFENVKARLKAAVENVKHYVRSFGAVVSAEAQEITGNTVAEAYVDTGVKILIAVVIGALLLGGLYALFNSTIMPTVTQKITELFNYAG